MAVSTYCVLWTLWLCKERIAPRGVIYWLPTLRDIQDFVNTKLDPMVRENEDLITKLSSTETDNKGLKFFWGAPTYWRNLKSASAVKSISADADIFDEYDETDPSQVAQALKRTSASTVKLRRRLSTPTLPDYGINKSFQATDQCHWGVKCSHCGYWSILEELFPRCMIPHKEKGYILGCVNCSKELNPRIGQWIRKINSPLRGYQISQLYSPFVTAREIMDDYHNTEFQGHFHNHVLGLPFMSASDKVTAVQVLNLCQPYKMALNCTQSTVMGIDQGRVLHCVVMQPGTFTKIVWAGEVKDFEEVDRLMLKFNVRELVIDALPETRKARELMKRNQNKVWLCFYNEHQKGSYSWNEEERIVSVNRTESLDVGTDAIIQSKIVLPERTAVIEELAQHCANIAKTTEEDRDTGSRRFVYKKLGPDHYRHAMNYAQIAASRLRSTKVISINR